MIRENIVKILRDKKTPSLSLIELNDKLGLKTSDELKSLEDVLSKFISEGVIYYSEKKKNYTLLENTHFLQGKFILNPKGYGFVSLLEKAEDVYIHESNVNGASSDDIVLIEIINYYRNEGRVVRIIKKDDKNLIGEVYFKGSNCYVRCDDRKQPDILIISGKISEVVEGTKVVVKRVNKTNDGEIINIIGHKNDVGVDILSFVYQYNFHPEFSLEVKKELESIPNSVSKEDIKDRRDLQEEVIFTIDGDDTKDIDDAVSIKKLKNGNYLLGVHIADVSHYVERGSKIDKEAYFRGTSVYLVDRVVPMLDHKLSNGICSLNPGVCRLALSCEMEINSKGVVVSRDIFPSVIKSRLQMTYKKVNDILEKNIHYDEYKPFEDDLFLMQELSNILRNKMILRGYLDFDVKEAKILVDEVSHPVNIVLREQRTGERIIENFMICANETVSSFLTDMALPCIYRVHDFPNKEKLESLYSVLSLKGINFKKDSSRVNAFDYQRLLKELKKKNFSDVFSSLVIRSMSKAKYSDINIGHFGLGSSCYSHFTSPIRRYPDLTLHRLIKDMVFCYDSKAVSYWSANLSEIANNCSIKEQDAINCERDVDKMKKAEYMESYIGCVYDAVISGVMPFGLFACLDNTVEGLIKIADLPKDYYIYDEKNMTLNGRRECNRFSFGDKIKVKVISASKENSMVDFAIYYERGKNEEKKKKSKGKTKI